MARASILDEDFLSCLDTLDFALREVRTGFPGGTRQTRREGSSLEWLDYRDYVPGDDLRRLDWSLAARFDRYYTRHYADERQLSNRIYIDTSASMGFDEDGRKALLTLRLAAAMGYLSAARLDRYAFWILRGGCCEPLTGSLSGKEALNGAIRLLEGVTFDGACDLGRALLADTRPGAGNGLSIILSDFLTDSDWQRAVLRLLELKRQVILVRVRSAEELEPTCGGPLELADTETGELLRAELDRSLLDCYHQALAETDRELTAFCRKYGVTLLCADPSATVSEILLRRGTEAGVFE